MILETFETKMIRNNTTLPDAQNTARAEEKDVRAAASFGKSYRKNTAMIAAFYMALCLICLLSTAGAAAINKRAIPSDLDRATPKVKTCKENNPCGWAIYIPFTRRIDYFMKNTCECSSTLACLKTDDDLSVNAYVYRCKPRPLYTTTEEPITTEDFPEMPNEENTNNE